MRRPAVSIWPLCLSLALAGTLSGGSALADLPPGPPPVPAPRPDKAASPTSKDTKAAAANTKDTKPSASPTTAPADTAAPPVDTTAAVPADQPMDAATAMPTVGWKTGPLMGELGNVAEINVPEGFVFTDGNGTRKFMELTENLTSGKEIGTVATADLRWFVIFEFSEIGYVKDDEKEELDADALLKSMRESTEAANQTKKSRGWSTMTLLGWATPPKYDESTNNLEWASRLQDDASKNISVNHFIRVLGRQGVMEVGLVTSPDDYAAALPESKKLLGAFSFKAGQKYSEFRQGDRIAAIGLTGLITGGAIAAAAKTGLLAKIFKVGVKPLILIGTGVAAALAKLFGRKKEQG